jgi:hypothetical protein
MQEHGMYFGKQDYYDTIRMNGGTWNDSKERPLVCLMKSIENEHLYWSIPVGDWSDKQSIFFISDVIPITDKYIEREYIGRHTNQLYVIKNKTLLSELKRKLSRILSWENVHKNSFRQHITDLKTYLLMELEHDTESTH